MIYLKQAVVVEGKYDKIKIDSILQAPMVVVTEGFRVFRSESKKNLVRTMAKKFGVVVLTDSDRAGQLIRNRIKSFVQEGKVYFAYIPKISGKEKRKANFSKEGLLGVEAMSEAIILDALKKAGVFCYDNKANDFGKIKIKSGNITSLHLAQAGLLGFASSKRHRKLFLKQIGLPDYLSTKQLLNALNATFSECDFNEQVALFKKMRLNRFE